MIAAFTLEEVEMLCRTAGDRRWPQGTGLFVLNHDEKQPILFFFCLFNKSFLKQQHAQNAARSAEIHVLGLLKLQNVFLHLQS